MKLTKTEFDLMVAEENARPRKYGRINAYVCELCEAIIVSVDRDAGTTPFMIPCDNPAHATPPAEMTERRRRRLVPEALRELEYKGPRMPDGRPISARSCFYRVPAALTEKHAKYEFYRPSFDEYEKMPDGPIATHIENGGLNLRRIGETAGELEQLEK